MRAKRIVDVEICTEDDDVLLTTAKGQCIRFPVPEVRVFKGRDSMGVRGINLAQGDTRHLHGDPSPCGGDRRGAGRLSQDAARRHGRTGGRCGRRRGGSMRDEEVVSDETALDGALRRDERRRAVHPDLSEKGYGKRTSSYEYRITGRGGKGHHGDGGQQPQRQPRRLLPGRRQSDQIMLVTDGGQLIRVPVDGIRTVGRGSQGVTVFSTRDKERVVSVEHIEGEDAEDVVGEDDPEIGPDESGA